MESCSKRNEEPVLYRKRKKRKRYSESESENEKTENMGNGLFSAYSYNEKTIVELCIGQMNIVCECCGALHFSGERTGNDLFKFLNCCRKGKIRITEPAISASDLLCEVKSNALAFISSLLKGSDERSKEFLENIRSYNGTLAFASINSEIDVFKTPGPYVYRVHGQIYHRISPVDPGKYCPRFNQLYFINRSEAVKYREEDAKIPYRNILIIAISPIFLRRKTSQIPNHYNSIRHFL
mmetsp:Transcript_5481/g.9654  ORF Transcript_5481/g.9654 Transcript_5481/m.9654 type:complete len:238 (-) Transcript_5481:280-993(-)